MRGRYRIVGKLGRGGMGAVYKALHTKFDQLRALKVMLGEWAANPESIQRFEREAVLMSKLQHPNVVRVDDIDETEDGRPFIVMEFLEGRSLRQAISEEGPFPPLRVCSIAKQAAAGLEAAHRLGMVHRDIKPDNLFLVNSPEGEKVKVLDFGIAKLKEARLGDAHLTATGVVIGTGQYLSPEQATGMRSEELDGRSDLYSLGLIMYQMLSRELPFHADTWEGWRTAHIKASPRPLLSVQPDLKIPEGLARLVMRCLEKQRDLRPANAQELIREIQQVEAEIQQPAAPHASPAVVTPASSPPKDSKVPIAVRSSGASPSKSGPWTEGQIIRGKYRVLEMCGMGGLAIFYKALQLKSGIVRAIEVANDENREIFQQYARERIRLQHPNIKCAVEVDEAEDGRPYMVTEWVEGRSLERVMQQECPLAPSRACAIVRQVAAGLGAAHALGVVHGQVYPLNIYLLEDPAGEKVKMVGFGMSAHPTLHYASPEHFMGTRLCDLDGRSDLFSLGAILYQMLTGEKLFPGENLTTFAMAIFTRQPKPVRTVRPDLAIPDSLANLVMRCLEKNRDLRPASARELIQEIERVEYELQQPPPVELSPTVVVHMPEPQGGNVAGAGRSEPEPKGSASPPEDQQPGLKFLKIRPSLKKTCPQCHGVYPRNFSVCTQDGASLLWLDRWTVGSLIKAKSIFSMMGEDDSLRLTDGEYRLLASRGDHDPCLVFKALELGSGRERTLVIPRIDSFMAPQNDVLTEAFEAFAQGVNGWMAHGNENHLEIAGLSQDDDGRPILVLDLEEGRTLEEVIRQEAPLPPRRACALARQIASALGALHAGGLIYGGAIPKNVLVSGSPGAEKIKVLPLGFQKLQDAWRILDDALGMESEGLLIGDYSCLAPEEIMGKNLDARVDLYKLGVVLYEMLTANRPFKGAKLSEYLNAVCKESPIPIATVRPELNLPKKLEALVTRLLERDPSRRPANVREVINEITQVEEDLRRAATPAPAPKGVPAPAASTIEPPYVPKPGEWPQGAIVREKYRVLTKIDEGGMSVAYKVLHLAFEDFRALNVFRPGLFRDEASRKTFKQELMRTCRLRHPNVMRVDDVDETEDGRPFMVMEFLQGRNLQAVLKSESPFAPKRVCTIIKQAASGLAAGHQLGLIHGDVKPWHILLVDTPAGEVVKLMNYGYVAIMAGLVEGGVVVGTPRYMSPEVVMGKPRKEIDGRVDLYPLGLMMYEMLTADFPFRASTDGEMMSVRVKQPPVPIGSAHPELNVPRDLAALILRLLEKNPDRRPASAQELVREIERIERQM